MRGTGFIARWACAEPISSREEHARRCLKVKYLGRIKYGFQKSCVTGPWERKVSVSATKLDKNDNKNKKIQSDSITIEIEQLMK